MMQAKLLAERSLILQQPDGSRKPIVVRIGTPYWVTEGQEAACPVEIEGMYEKLADVHGVDLYQALELAIQLVNYLLTAAKSKRQKLLWPDGRLYEIAVPPLPRKTLSRVARTTKKTAKARPARRKR